jgi:hypothetical protein
MSDFEDSLEVMDNIVVDEVVEEVPEQYVAPFLNHCIKVMKKVAKGAKKGQEVIHFDCNYCSKDFQGPSNSTFLKLLPEENKTKPVRDFFTKTRASY